MIEADDNPALELFRLAALRPPKLVLGTVPRIGLEPGEDATTDGIVDPVTGELEDVPMVVDEVETVFPFRDLDRELARVGDRWDPGAIADWVCEHTDRSLEELVGSLAWQAHRQRVHAALTRAASFQGEQDFGVPTALLRACRLIALLEGIAAEVDELSDEEAVRLFLGFAIVQLPGSLVPTRPSPLARPPAIADLKVVRLGPPRYEPGAIAHIENVMASEKRERTHRLRQENEQTTTRVTERVEESERDLTTTSQVQMQQEAMSALRSSTDIEAGLRVSASYGPTVSVEADARLAHHSSSETVNREAASLSNSITQQARQRVVERTQEIRTVRQLLEVEETNFHGFDNSGAGAEHVVGIYRYVDQVQDAWIENYGKRLMLEFMVPEPAAILQWALEPAPGGGADPEPPRPKNPGNPAEDLSPQHIDELNYLGLVGQFGASGVKAPPPPGIELAVTFKPQADDDLYLFEDSKTLKVPAGYHASSWVAQCVTWGAGGGDHSWMVGVGENADPVEDNDGGNLHKHLSGALDAHGDSLIPVVMLGRGLLSLSASVRVHCDRTAETLNAWRLSVFERVMNAWEASHQEWEARHARAEALARADSVASPLQGGASQDENRAVERRELRRSVIHMLLGAPQDSGPFAGQAVTRPPGARPTLELDVVAAERDGIAFFEQAFEWTNMTWVHYPYYWADPAEWADSIRRTANDAQWAAFLSAGASRVAVPVRPGFEWAVGLYLTFGVIWAGGQVPTVGDPSFLGIAEEIAETLGTGGVEPDRTPLEPVRLPTQLIWLQPTADLNPDAS